MAPRGDDGGSEDEVEIGSPQFDLVLGENGDPCVGVEEVEFLAVSPPKHTPYGPTDTRRYARLRVIRTGQVVLKVWNMICGGCGRGPNAVCKRARLKPGMSGFFRRDLSLAMGRSGTPNERVPIGRLFLGKRFRTALQPATEDSDRNLLPRASWYTRAAGPLLPLGEEKIAGAEETLTSTLAETRSSTPTTTDTTTNLDQKCDPSGSGDWRWLLQRLERRTDDD